MQDWYESKGAEAAVVRDPETGEERLQSGAGIDPFLHASFIDMMERRGRSGGARAVADDRALA